MPAPAGRRRGKQPQTRAKKQVAEDRSPVQIRQMAAQLRGVAETLEACAADMERLGIDAIRPLPGNFHRAVETLREFAARQVLARVAVAAHERFRPADDREEGAVGESAGRSAGSLGAGLSPSSDDVGSS